ncbi:MAG: peptidoglycan DD-metalloendopeptidase family protein [Firmicutes bacterium]|nr:peptidoglycan DD-metalloendopeptidase family protein [Bacillota bacterium]
MPKSLRHAAVLFLLGLLFMASTLGGETRKPLGLGGPEEEIAAAWAEPVKAADAPGASLEPAGEPIASAEPLLEETSASSSDEPPAEEAGPPRPAILTHTVARGETLWDIARRYGIDVDTIVAANDLTDIDRLQVGEKLTILTMPGALHTVRRGESLWDIARTYQVPMNDIVAANGLADPSRLQVNERLFIPGGQAQAVALRREALVDSNGRLLRNFDWPAQGRISSRYGMRWGRMHHGLDIAVPTGTPVRAAGAGTVSYAGSMGGYGLIVILQHGNGVETRYAHNSRLVVRVGQRVKRGDIIAYSGNTGNSTGPHIHFEIRYRGQSVNPERYLKR